MDAANIDLKGFTGNFYRNLCSTHDSEGQSTYCHARTAVLIRASGGALADFTGSGNPTVLAVGDYATSSFPDSVNGMGCAVRSGTSTDAPYPFLQNRR